MSTATDDAPKPEPKAKALKGKVLIPFGYGSRGKKRMTQVNEVIEFSDAELFAALLEEKKISKL